MNAINFNSAKIFLETIPSTIGTYGSHALTVITANPTVVAAIVVAVAPIIIGAQFYKACKVPLSELADEKPVDWSILPPELYSLIFSEMTRTDYLPKSIVGMEISKGMQQLTSKFISDWIRVNPRSLKELGCKNVVEGIQLIKNTKLQRADFSEFSDFSDKDLSDLVKNCPNLHHLAIESAKITGDNLSEALKKLIDLQSLNLTGCHQISEEKLSEALKKPKNIQSLDLSWCAQLSEDKLAEALQMLPNLQNLNLKGCRQISEEKLAEALKVLKNLQSLDISWSDQITGEKLSEALKSLPKLQTVNLRFCSIVKEEKLAEASKRLPGLHIIF
jgi:uncharacterized protein YjbI with pentapeptide repeats